MSETLNRNADKKSTGNRGSNVYPNYMLWSKNSKNVYTPVYPCFLYKSGVQGGITFYEHVFLMISTIVYVPLFNDIKTLSIYVVFIYMIF